MRSYKKFTDAIAIIAVFVAFIYVFIAFRAFEPYETVNGETVKFYQDETIKPYINIGLLFLAAGLCGIVFNKMPAIGLATSLFPMWFSIKYYYLREITKRPMLFIVSAAIVLAGNIVATTLYFKKEKLY